MSIKGSALAMVGLALILGGPAVVLAQQKSTIQGTVQYLDAPLPANATLWVTLEDAATGADLIALEKEGVVGGKAQPFPFTMELDSNRVVPSARYRVIAEITDSETSRNRLYAGVSAPFAITVNGTTNVPQFRAFYRPGALGSPSGGMFRILAALALAGLAGLIALWRRKRARPLARQLA
ncbi:MAG TPA: YbaY family lipoprotein [Roseiflexaceae bacterium]|nr:YbaY family lipoprotein [Roseiflexaceae bacterium]